MMVRFSIWCIAGLFCIQPHVAWAGEDDMCRDPKTGAESRVQKFEDRFRQIEETNKCEGILITILESGKTYEARCVNSSASEAPSLAVVSQRESEILFTCAGPQTQKERLYRCQVATDTIKRTAIKRGVAMTTAMVRCSNT